ncbi:MAG: hypothetical protein ACI308_06240 [Muribaculaceae bacterium]
MDFTTFNNDYTCLDGMQYDTTNSPFGSLCDFMESPFMSQFTDLAHEYNLPDDVVAQAAADAYNFFNMPESPIFRGAETCVWPGNPFVMDDDRLDVNVDQLKGMGVHDTKTLSLILTHEIVHRLTQDMLATGQLSPWQGEALSDMWMGIRGAMQGIDVQPAIDSLKGGVDCETHPGFDLREEYINKGCELYEEMKASGEEINYESLMAKAIHDVRNNDELNQREIEANREALYSGGHRGRAAAFSPSYSKGEIDSHIKEAQNKIDHLKSVIHDHTRIMKDRAAQGLPIDSEKYTIGSAKIDLENAKKELEKWQNTKPAK